MTRALTSAPEDTTPRASSMARKPQPWFRFYVETVGDPKVRRIPFDKRWLWAAVLSAARESPTPGWLYIAENVPMTFQELADYAGAPLRAIAPTLEIMRDLAMIDIAAGVIRVVNWDARQFESDDVTARTRTHRERSKERSIEHPKNVRGNTPETETETENRDRSSNSTNEGSSRTATRDSTTPPIRTCQKHPHGTDQPCHDCANDRRTIEARDAEARVDDAKARDARIRAKQDAAINQDLNRGHAQRAVFDQAKADAEAALATRRAAATPEPQPDAEPPIGTELKKALAAAAARRTTQGADA